MAPVATGIKKENVIANKRKWAKMNSHWTKVLAKDCLNDKLIVPLR